MICLDDLFVPQKGKGRSDFISACCLDMGASVIKKSIANNEGVELYTVALLGSSLVSAF